MDDMRRTAMSSRTKSRGKTVLRSHVWSNKPGGKTRKTSKQSVVKSNAAAGGAARVQRAVASRKDAGMSIKLFSRLTGFSERAIAGWEAGEPVSESARRRLLEVERFHKRLAEVVKPGSIPDWLDTPNDAFDGLKPIEVIERGEVDRLWNMIFYLESGIAT
jgi:DNA-binding transcriptional regulator YiaG